MSSAGAGWWLHGPNGTKWGPVQIKVLGKKDMLENLTQVAGVQPVSKLSDAWLAEQVAHYPDDSRMVWSYFFREDGKLAEVAMVYGTEQWNKFAIQWPHEDASWTHLQFKKDVTALIRQMMRQFAESLSAPMSRKELQKVEDRAENFIKDLPKKTSGQEAPPIEAGGRKINPDGSTGQGPARWS